MLLVAIVLLSLVSCGISMPEAIAARVLEELKANEEVRSQIAFRGLDRRASTPLISGDGFRSYSQHICDETNNCRMDPSAVKDNDVIFVKTDLFELFATSVIPRINASYIIVSHNSDCSAPDGQDDAPAIDMAPYTASRILTREHRRGRLLAHHAQNLWWKNTSSPRPVFSHCLPIGLENRHWSLGRQVLGYGHYLLHAARLHLTDALRPWLLVAFPPNQYAPDRQKALSALALNEVPTAWANQTQLTHSQWMEAIALHKFVLAPFGHGLDTHRITEILLMGGIPVMRRSSISSCYDDTDNELVSADGRTMTRGSLPVVVLDRWEDLTLGRLQEEWRRISAVPPEQWDWGRLFMEHWLRRIRHFQLTGPSS